MKTVVNIGTVKKNLVGEVFDKPFDKINYRDIYERVEKKIGSTSIIGWVNMTKNDDNE
jgi:hypothetical protein